MKQDHIQRVRDMNNTGVDFLVVGLFHTHSARAAFAKATEATKLLLIEDDNDNTNENCARATETGTSSHSTDWLFQSCSINIPFCADKKYDASLAVEETHIPSSEDSIFIYHRAFKLRYHHYDRSPLQSVCFVILYNMGIVFHLPYIGSCSPEGLKQAATYYGGLAISTCCHGTPITNDILPVLRRIILNNLGEIYFRLCR